MADLSFGIKKFRLFRVKLLVGVEVEHSNEPHIVDFWNKVRIVAEKLIGNNKAEGYE